MIKKYLLICLFWLCLGVLPLFSHHYKGLPHYNYFDNYPQVPILEFIEEGEEYTVFVTVYNFQGLDLGMVDAPNDVRFYIYVYNLKTDKSYIGKAHFNLYSSGKLVGRYINIKQEEERIYSLRAELLEQDEIVLETIITEGEREIALKTPMQLKPGFWDKYGVYASIVLFFVVVALLKTFMKSKTNDKSEFSSNKQ